MYACDKLTVYGNRDSRAELLSEFSRLLKPGGILSIVKHNKAGKIMHKAVFEYKINEALELLHDGQAISANFGIINEYDNRELEKYCEDIFIIDKVYGVRMFFALQRNELIMEPDWISEMYHLECSFEEIPEFRNIAYFHHIILKHTM